MVAANIRNRISMQPMIEEVKRGSTEHGWGSSKIHSTEWEASVLECFQQTFLAVLYVWVRASGHGITRIHVSPQPPSSSTAFPLL